MHGPHPLVQDIELILAPEDIPVVCNVQLDEEDYIDVVEPAQQAYRVETVCVKCSLPLRLVVECSHADIRALEQLLRGTLNLVCTRCV
ncbi:E7 [Human papillomavirus 117]|uniref:Protein E7 n=1 Tax=Human papillomavirus 117 TaxID=720708 RepID=D3VWC7_9PAPI|nr:E7 [Human papillomavirus 117]